MFKKLLALPLVCGALALPGCGSKGQTNINTEPVASTSDRPQGNYPVNRVRAATSKEKPKVEAGSWKALDSKEGGFSVLVPEVSEPTVEKPGADGAAATYQYISSARGAADFKESNFPAVYFTTASQFAPGKLKAKLLLEKAWHEDRANKELKQEYARQTRIDGHDAWEWKMTGQAGGGGGPIVKVGRTIVSKDRTRVWNQMGLMSQAQSDAGDATKYLDSFKAN